ncbi:MAG: diguanylate cyclase [Bacillota bacterium]
MSGSKINKTQDGLLYQKQCFEALFKNSLDAIVFTDERQLIIDINTRFTELFGYALEECKGKHAYDLLAPEHLRFQAQEIAKQVYYGDTVEIETVRFAKGCKPIHVSVKAVPIIINNKVVGGYGIYSDISARKAYEEELKRLSMYDALTGLYNRAFFNETLKRLDTNRQLPLSIIMGDINGLKLVNDAFGHEAGDKYLINVAEILRKACRKEDIVCRIGGDEFAIVFATTSLESAEKILARIHDACAGASKDPIPVSISFGAAAKIEEGQDIRGVLRAAEDRMYQNKLLKSRKIRSTIIAFLQKTLWESTYETEEHSHHIGLLAHKIGEALELSAGELDELYLLAALHDVGKVGIPQEILLKTTELSPQEWEVVKKHCEIGHRIAQATPELAHISEKILAHHEYWDGTGYPQGLKGVGIPLASRILAIADAFVVMTNGRPYKTRLSKEEALKELTLCRYPV